MYMRAYESEKERKARVVTRGEERKDVSDRKERERVEGEK